MHGSLDKARGPGDPIFLFLAFVFAFSLGIPDILYGYWRFDDGGHLLWALEHNLLDYFLNIDVTRKVSMGQLTPWNTFFYDLNISLFGLSPRAMYLHLHLVSGIVSALLFQLMREFHCERWVAILLTLAFIISAPWQSVSHGLMTGHYVYGMAFCQLALILALRSIGATGGASLIMMTLSGVAYAAAVSCKELYVPVPTVLVGVVLLNDVARDNGRRPDTFSRYLGVFSLWGSILIGYIFWRHAVTGSMQGGYLPSASLVMSDNLPLIDVILSMCHMLVALPASGLNWLTLVYLLFIVTIILLLLKMAWLERLAAFFFIAASLPVVLFLVFLAAPLLKLIEPPPRYAVMLIWSMLLVAAISFRGSRHKPSPARMFQVSLGVFLLANITYVPTHLWPKLKESESYYKFATLPGKTAGVLLLPEVSSARYTDQLWAIRKGYTQNGLRLPETTWKTAEQPHCPEEDNVSKPAWFWSQAEQELIQCE